MKISKLFHWLYAILMLLPFLVFVPNAFYYGFNEHAVAQEKTEQVPVYYESNEVNNISDIVVGNIYRIYYDDVANSQTNITESFILVEEMYVVGENVYFNDVISQQRPYIQLVYSGGRNNLLYSYPNQSKYRLLSGYIDFVYKTYTSNLPYQYIKQCETQYVKEYLPLTTSMSITDSMSYAWDSVWQNDLFSWSYGSFLTEPFIYIGNVFNVPVDNSLYYALSYWLDISIIWLCFDLVMYIPLLVHRWLDKGIIE